MNVPHLLRKSSGSCTSANFLATVRATEGLQVMEEGQHD